MKRVSYLMFIILIITSCGQQGNSRKNTYTLSPNQGSPNQGSNYQSGPFTGGSCNRLNFPQCRSGSRLQEVTYSIGGSGGYGYRTSRVSGTLTAGGSGGRAIQTFYGNSSNGDTIIVTKTDNGYDIKVALCPFNTNGFNYIGGGASLSNFMADGLVLEADGVCCGNGQVTAGSITFSSQPTGGSGYYKPTPRTARIYFTRSCY